MMQCRLLNLELVLAGLKKTGLSLVSFDGHNYLPASSLQDDYGIYVIIPHIALWANLSIAQAVNLFFAALCTASALISIAGFCALYKSWPSRLLAIAVVGTLSTISYALQDVYSLAMSLPIMIVPWVLYFTKKSDPSSVWYFFLVLAGFGIGCSHYIRAHAGTATLLFILVLLAFWGSRKQKLIACLCVGLGWGAASSYFQHTVRHYHNFMQTNHLPDQLQVRHPFWHIVYMGLGFITNDLGLTYDDTTADRRVTTLRQDTQSIAASSEAYEQTLRKDVWRIVTRHPFYVVRVMIAKLSLILFYLLLFAHFGLLACIRGLLSPAVSLAFTASLCWSALPGLIAIPSFYYLSGFATFAGLLAIVGSHELLKKNYEKVSVSCRTSI